MSSGQKFLAIAISVAVMLSRIILAMHYPADIFYSIMIVSILLYLANGFYSLFQKNIIFNVGEWIYKILQSKIIS